jgi:hypothetical protein
MKKIIFLLLVVMNCLCSFSQGIAINTNNATADASSLLDISSHDKGVLIPRLRTSERTAIANPSFGLLVYDVDTRSFWYFDNGNWKEILNNSSTILPIGPASGDLYGSYPSPNVVKIQNLDVAFGVPFDKQVMKWDALNNKWQGLNDSLFLPYNVTFGSATKLFGITNTNTTNGATAVYGKGGITGAGITPGTTVGVWGDNSTGVGVIGTSNSGVGTYGFSFQNHGIYGYTTNNSFAGVYGSHANNGAGIMGEVSGQAVGVYGRATGSMGKAGVFESSNTSNNDTVVWVKNSGLGSTALFQNTNSANGNSVVSAVTNAVGDGFYAEMNNITNTPNAAFRGINNSLGGYGVYAESALGRSGYFFNSGNINNQYAIDAKTNGTSSAGNFTITNSSNNNYILNGTSNGTGGGLTISLTNALSTGVGINLSQNGTGNGIYAHVNSGRGLWLDNTSTTTTTELLYANMIGKGNAGKFIINNSTNSNSGIYVSTNGTGRALEAVISNSSSNIPAIYGNSSGNKAIEGLAQVNGVIGQTTGLTGGIGVLGQSYLNSADGIGVKGISYSTGANSTSGAVTAINNADGTAMYAEATGGGVAVYGKASRINGSAIYAFNDASQGQALRGSAIGTDGVGVYGEAGNSNSNSIAGSFRNNYFANTRNVVQIISNGNGKGLYVENSNAGASADLVVGKYSGTGKFISFQDGAGTPVTTVEGDGDITTAGTITVKNNKGIVRNSSSTQMRIETLTANIAAGNLNHYDDQFNGGVYLTFNFGTAFSSPPSVYIGNVISGSLQGLTAIIQNVTTTSFQLVIGNYTPYNFTYVATSLKIIAVGAE